MHEEWSEGLDGDNPRYVERVWPAGWLWIVALGMAGSWGVAVGAAVTHAAGWASFALAMALAVVGLIRGATVLRVDDRVFRAGRARLPLRFVGRVAPLDEAQSRSARGPKADISGYFALRTLATRTSVMVEVTDEDDPHSTWLVSTRRPVELARAIAAGRDAAKGDD
jgi:Protein of unknown function (DUF3093)